ncbi:uncharacterized protein LOC113290916 [Papaver somniferum]|uniref:uncharacterized protein LOC113290916 n=1 Tax=Papaver somniferum TaxID=3469 RepID=UPI000E704D1F|nr:uncharacterized protein LOC113290916 [Papaver somniferum]
MDLGEKYLGTPTMFQASKIQTHMGILQAIDARISIWLHKLLSQAARTTLIKHIGQAIPLFQTGAFLIPKHLCRQMESHLCKFWWGETLDPKDRKLHLLGWDILCSPKSEGDLDFRKAELNNLAMIARNAWRIIENPNCMLATVLKAKYFPRTDFLNAQGWSIIDPWCDKWISDLGFATPNPLVPHDPNVKVSYFINNQTRTWDVNRLNTQFDDAYVKKIITIPVSQLWTPDRRLGNFQRMIDFLLSLPTWELEVLGPPHVSIFGSAFGKLGFLTESNSFSGKLLEMLYLLEPFYILECPCIVLIVLDALIPTNQCFFVTVLWSIWNNRNNLVFQNLKETHFAVLARAMLLARKPCLTISPTTSVSQCDKWIPPSFGWIKCNTDGAYDDISGDNDAGYVMRDFASKASFCASLVFEVKSVEEAEARAIWAVLKKAKEEKFTHIIIESDAKGLSDQFSSGMFDGDSRTDVIFKDILFFSSNLVACIFPCQPRYCNSVAHELAQWAKLNNSFM